MKGGLGLKTSVEIAEEKGVEFIALLLLAPLIWSSNTSAPSSLPPSAPLSAPLNSVTPPTAQVAPISLGAAPRLESKDGHWVVRPPQDSTLTMTVLEHRPAPDLRALESRGPASIGSRRIDVIVSAP